jgi:hypothetical protein
MNAILLEVTSENIKTAKNFRKYFLRAKLLIFNGEADGFLETKWFVHI